MDFRYLLDHVKTLCIAFLCMAFLGHPVIADEVIETAAPIKQTAFSKSTSDISGRELTDKLVEILKETSKAKSVEITGHYVMYENAFKTLKANKIIWKYSRNGNFVIEYEAITDKVILEKYRDATKENGKYKLVKNDIKGVMIWDGEYLTFGEESESQFYVDETPIDMTIRTGWLDFGRTMVEGARLPVKFFLVDSMENLQKDFKTDIKEENGQILLTLKPRTQKYKKDVRKITLVFDIKTKEVAQIRIKDVSGTTETVLYIDSIKRSPDELEINPEQILEKYEPFYFSSSPRKNRKNKNQKKAKINPVKSD